LEEGKNIGQCPLRGKNIRKGKKQGSTIMKNIPPPPGPVEGKCQPMSCWGENYEKRKRKRVKM
jgi:hypothetical protein